MPPRQVICGKRACGLTIEAGPNHISVYDLQVGEGTKLGILDKPGESPFPSYDESADFYRVTSGMLCDADAFSENLRTANDLEVPFREAFGDCLFLPICNIFRPHMASGHVIFMGQYGEVIKAEELDWMQGNAGLEFCTQMSSISRYTAEEDFVDADEVFDCIGDPPEQQFNLAFCRSFLEMQLVI
ncbi:hypothetical protein MLD38_012582 [Melastoma candidum]|uniref:Uncharacterized protein n=1 Tax=Melastoma candidum TaxID=119954 RepID=A0ACB9R7V2_9MYRT|nr:hypothetical protein MLD38_012582 [Melastoma candidum]